MHSKSLAGAAIMLCYTAASAEEARPSGGWRVDYGETQCVALRDLTEDREKILFAIRPAFGGGSYELMLTKKGPAPSAGGVSGATIDFGQGKVKVDQISYRLSDGGLAVTRLRVPDSLVPQLKSAKAIELTAFGHQHWVPTDSMGPLITALDACVRDLEKYWNKGTTMAVPAKPTRDIRLSFSYEDYPGEALSRDREGDTQYVLLISPDGKIAGCDLVRASGDPSLDFMGCQVLMKKAKFTGARDSANRPARDSYFTPPVRWRIEN